MDDGKNITPEHVREIERANRMIAEAAGILHGVASSTGSRRVLDFANGASFTSSEMACYLEFSPCESARHLVE